MWIRYNFDERNIQFENKQDHGKFELLINIDETISLRYTKASYSWSNKGKESNLKNIWFLNLTSLITALTTNGDVFEADTYGFVIEVWSSNL